MTKNTSLSKSYFAVFIIITVALFSRMVPHPPNFTAVGATALFAGACLRPRWAAVLLPILLLLVSDAIIGFYDGIVFSYAAWVLVVLVSSLYLKSENTGTQWLRRVGLSFFSSGLFFILSNFGVWYSTGIYSADMKGLVDCYAMAIPFFGYEFAGTLIFTSLLFAIWDLLPRAITAPSKIHNL